MTGTACSVSPVTRKATARTPSIGALGRKTAAENVGTSAKSCRVYASEKAIRIAMLTQSAAMRPAGAAVPQSLLHALQTHPTMLGQDSTNGNGLLHWALSWSTSKQKHYVAAIRRIQIKYSWTDITVI